MIHNYKWILKSSLAFLHNKANGKYLQMVLFKGQLISKQNERNDSILAFRSFFGRTYGSTILFRDLLTFRKDSNFAMKASLCIAGGIPEGICIEYLEFIALSPIQFA